MKKTKRFVAYVMALAAAVAFSGVSAFAESRPSGQTRIKREGKSGERSGRAVARSEGRRSNDSSNSSRSRIDRRSQSSNRDRGVRPTYNRGERSGSGREIEVRGRDLRRRNEITTDRDRSTRQNRGRNESFRQPRNDSRRSGTYRGDSHRSHGSRQPYYARGRVSRVNPYRGGYRVWVGGAPYPFFIPTSHWHRDRFRIGVSINIGGYYNPLGYYDYYDRYDYRASSTGYLRGVVESVDHRRDTFVVRNEATGSFVTVLMLDRRDQVRAGDYVELDGSWSRAGVFQARRVEFVEDYGR